MSRRSAVAIVETPKSFVLEGRPDLPGRLAYAGKLQLFGGHVESDEDPRDAVTRELLEEASLRLTTPPELLWDGITDSQNRAGESVRRYVSLFRVTIASVTELTLNVPGTIAEINKTGSAVQERQDQLTPFAFRALNIAVSGDSWKNMY